MAGHRRRAKRTLIVDSPLTTADLKPYLVKKLRSAADQPLLLARRADRAGSQRAFRAAGGRGLSLLFALITVIATAEIGRRWLGPIGILGGAILVSLPTWETLVLRAGSDAFACMLAAVAVVISVSAPRRPLAIAAETLVWGLAINAKMYTWPLLIILPVLWWRQRASKSASLPSWSFR